MSVDEDAGAIVRALLRGADSDDLAPHQRIAAAATISLLRSRGGVLLADAPGVGKTHVAITVARFFESQSREVAIFVPAALVGQWRRMCDTYGVRSSPMSHETLLRGAPRGAPDLVIVDEAHRFRNRSAARHDRLAQLATGSRVLLVTATPVWNSNADLSSLLRFIMPDYPLQLAGGGLSLPFDRGAQIIRRDDDVLPPGLRFSAMEYRFEHYEQRVPADIRELIESLTFPGLDPRHRFLLRHLLWRRLESSTAAFRETLRRLRSFVSRLKEANGRGLGISRRDFRRLFPPDETDLVQELLFPEVFFDSTAAPMEPESLDRETAVLTTLLGARIDEPKRRLLHAVLQSAREPAIVFTSSIATARSLYEEFLRRCRCALLTSRGIEAEGRRIAPGELLERHRRKEIDLLLTTDVGGEGLDLQAASIVIHYDLPWNLARIEQRNGRVSRIGQSRTPVAWFFVPDRSGSGIDRVLLEKTQLCSVVPSTIPQISFDVADDLPLRIGEAEGRAAGILGLSFGAEGVDEILFVDGDAVSGDASLFPGVMNALRRATRWREGEANALAQLVERHLASRRSELALVPQTKESGAFEVLLASSTSRAEVDLLTGPLRGMVEHSLRAGSRALGAVIRREAEIVHGCAGLPHRVVAAVVALERDQRAG